MIIKILVFVHIICYYQILQMVFRLKLLIKANWKVIICFIFVRGVILEKEECIWAYFGKAVDHSIEVCKKLTLKWILSFGLTL